MRNSISPKAGGYKSKRPKPKPKSKVEPVVTEPVVKSVPLPGKSEGIEGQLLAQVLKAKVKLLKHLVRTVGETTSVSIEVFDNEWVLLVHGPNPGLKYFDNYKVFWARSKVLSR